jgi:hypothetical protein
MSCKYCKELNKEKEKIAIDDIHIRTAGYFGYYCPIRYCPNCGKILDKYKVDKGGNK